MHDAVTDWQELSALYEKADLLSGAELQAWLATLRELPHPLVEPLMQMLSARAEIQDNGFLDAPPGLPPLADEASNADWHAGARIGPYRLQRPLGAGGMAEVWLAERDDGAFQRTVAIKLLFRHAVGPERDSFAQRFARERDILASLHHPHIAGLHDAGVTPSGQPWLALEYVEGEPLTAWCDAARLGVRGRVELFIQVLLAVQHAHANLVIHRDLKPANILVTKAGEARLLDFGIAKLMEAEGNAIADTELTRHAGRLMTVRYASPEQLTGQPLTTACDVYSLGVVLHELLCGELPYEMKVDSAAQLEHAILEVEPRPPSRRALTADAAYARGTPPAALRKLLGNDLDAITLRALAKQPAKRYASVEALRAELERWLLGEPVEARTPSSAYRFSKFAGRHVVGVSLGSAAVLALFVVATTAVWLGLKARQESARATAARDFMMGMFKQADTDKSHGADMTARQLLDRGRDDVLKRLKGQPALQADLLEGIAGIQTSMGEYTKADLTFEELAKLYTQIAEPRKAALAIAGRANNALAMGDSKKTHVYVEQAAESARTLGLQSDPEIAASLGLTAGWLALWEGDALLSKHLFESSAKQAESAFGVDSQPALSALVGVVQAEANLHNFPAAIAVQDEVTKRQAKIPEKTAQDYIESDLSYADLLYMAGHYRDVVRLSDTATPRCTQTLGIENTRCRRLLLTQARANLRMGSVASLSQEMAGLRAIANDESSPDVQVNALVTLLRALSHLKKLGIEPDLIARCRTLSRSSESVAPLQRVLFLQALAEDGLRSGKTRLAMNYLDQAMSLRGDSGDFVSSYAPTANTRILIGISMLLEERPESALEMLRLAQVDEVKVLGQSHPLAMLYSLNQAIALASLHRVGEALEMVAIAEPILRNALGPDSPTYQRVSKLQEWLASLSNTSPSANSERPSEIQFFY